MYRRLAIPIFSLLVCLLVLPLTASAQATIAGVARDESGAVLPGVTVEATSPALIEKVRTVVTNDQGLYRIIDLRPGIYSVTFTLAGFSTLVRDGIVLEGNFVANINGDLKVGSLEESLTVSGQTPVVDISQASRAVILTRDLIDSLPSSRNIMSVGQLVPGIRNTVPDVGGSRMMEQTQMFAHGASSRHTNVYMDGLQINAMKADGSTMAYQNESVNAEVSVTTSALPADVGGGGVSVNSIPKDGGNTFAATAFFAYTSGTWQSDNVSDKLRAKGLTQANRIEQIQNFTATLGGPILRDKIWFFIGWGHPSTDERVANVPDFIILPAGVPRPGHSVTEEGGVLKFDTVLDQYVASIFARMTAQPTSKNKVAGFLQRTFKKKGKDLAYGTDPYHASVFRAPTNASYGLGQAKWTSTVSNRLMLETGFSFSVTAGTTTVQNWMRQPKFLASGAINPAWLANARKEDTQLNKNPNCFLPDGCLVWGSSGASSRQANARQVIAHGISYVTGSHALKTGFTWAFGPFKRQNHREADLVQRYTAGVPQSVVVYTTPLDITDWTPYDLALYIQDAWTIKRLTLNMGLRSEYMSSGVNDASVPAGRFRPARFYPAQRDIPPNWRNDLAPRFSMAYDLFGDGTTAVKASASKYYSPYTSEFASLFANAVLVNETRNWFDTDLIPGTSTRSGISKPTNGDDIAQENEIGPSSNPFFGEKVDRDYNKDINKEYNIEFTGSIQRQLRPGVSVHMGYFRRTFYNLFYSDRTQISNADYTSFTLPMPSISVDPDAAAVLNQSEILTVYNLNAAKNSVYNAPLFYDNSTGGLGGEADASTYNGFETGFQARLRGSTFYGAWTVERNVSVFCDSNDNPNGSLEADQFSESEVGNGGRFCDQRKFSIPWRQEFKIAGTLPLPYGLEFATALQSYAGLPRNITWSPAASLFPGGRTQSQTILLNEPGSMYYNRYFQLDFNLKKTFRHGAHSYTGQFDFFNVLNNSSILSQVNTVGASLGQVQQILQGRLPRVVFQMRW